MVCANSCSRADFYPRPPRGGRRLIWAICPPLTHFYPRPPRGGRQGLLQVGVLFQAISIHALREEGDAPCGRRPGLELYFYPRPPRGGRLVPDAHLYTAAIFLSTPSARRATSTQEKAPRKHSNFYPRPPRGGRRWSRWFRSRDLRFLSTPSARRATADCYAVSETAKISIHALREEGDDNIACGLRLGEQFLSTPSARRATSGDGLRTGKPCHFYPRPPRGGRRLVVDFCVFGFSFLSTPSARRATACASA